MPLSSIFLRNLFVNFEVDKPFEVEKNFNKRKENKNEKKTKTKWLKLKRVNFCPLIKALIGIKII